MYHYISDDLNNVVSLPYSSKRQAALACNAWRHQHRGNGRTYRVTSSDKLIIPTF